MEDLNEVPVGTFNAPLSRLLEEVPQGSVYLLPSLEAVGGCEVDEGQRPRVDRKFEEQRLPSSEVAFDLLAGNRVRKRVHHPLPRPHVGEGRPGEALLVEGDRFVTDLCEAFEGRVRELQASERVVVHGLRSFKDPFGVVTRGISQELIGTEAVLMCDVAQVPVLGEVSDVALKRTAPMWIGAIRKTWTVFRLRRKKLDAWRTRRGLRRSTPLTSVRCRPSLDRDDAGPRN